MEYSLTLTANEVAYLLRILNAQPYAEVVELVPKIIQQTKQTQEAAAPAAEAE